MKHALLILSLFAAPEGPQDQTSAPPFVAGFERFGADGGEGGRLLLGELNCISCHKPEEKAAAHLSLKQAPILTEAGSRLNPEWIRAFLADPAKTKPGTTMPAAGVTPEESEALTHFLMSRVAAKKIEGVTGSAAKAKEIFNRSGCAACHAPLDGPALPGSVPLPDLRAKYASAAALAQFLADPLQTRPSGRMPRMNLTPPESMALATHFVGLPPRDADEPGETLPGIAFDYYEGSIGKVADMEKLKPVSSGTASSFDLKVIKKEDHIGLLFRGYLDIPRDGIYTFYTHSDDGSVLRLGDLLVVNNDGIHGGHEESGSIGLKKGKHAFTVGWFEQSGGEELAVRYEGPGIPKRSIPEAALSRPKTGPPVSKEASSAAARFTPDPALVTKGRELFASKRCASCHEAGPGLKSAESRPLASLKDGGCLGNAAGTPRYALTAKQVEAIRAALGALGGEKPSAARRIARTMTALNCFACHERGGKGGVTPERYPHFTTTYDDTGDEGRIPPHLTGVGAKLKIDWLRNVLVTAPKVRPYMNTRMPVFGSANVASMAEDFEKLDAVEAAPAPARDLVLLKAGRQLTGAKGLSCVQCHMFQNHKSLGIPGMDLVHMGTRLRRGWFTQYLLDPPSLRPGTRMPTFWPEGRSVRKDILDGDTAKQVEAIWQFLGEGSKAALPAGIGPQPIPLVPLDEALMYRNFIQGGGTRAIGVGYPEKAHLAWDANQMRPALLWQGDFIDASKHWVDRGAGFTGPAGENVIALHDGPPLAVLADPAAPWPKDSGKKAGYQFVGYDLDSKRRPAFLYTFGDVQVRDFFEAVDTKPHPGFKRTLVFDSKGPVYFRAAAAKKIEGAFKLENGLTLRIEGGEPVLRGGTEVIVPVKAGKSALVIHYAW